jgi:hypothetical protein
MVVEQAEVLPRSIASLPGGDAYEVLEILNRRGKRNPRHPAGEPLARSIDRGEEGGRIRPVVLPHHDTGRQHDRLHDPVPVA